MIRTIHSFRIGILAQALHRSLTNSWKRMSRQFVTSSSMRKAEESSAEIQGGKEPSERMKQFHEKLKLHPLPRVAARARFVELVLVEIDPKTGELIINSEEDPTKWGDWQTRGRVSDF